MSMWRAPSKRRDAVREEMTQDYGRGWCRSGAMHVEGATANVVDRLGVDRQSRTDWRQRSMARRQRWRSVATGRQRREAWISFSSPRRDARGDEIGEIDSRVAKRILYEFESEFVNFVVRKVTRGALSGSIGACGGVWGGRLVSGRREASAHSPNLIKNMGFFLDQYEFGGSWGRVVSGRKSPIQPASDQYAQGEIWK
jgi:hypothetical protein